MQLARQVDTNDQRKERKYNKGWENLRPAKPGEVRNPRGRPKKDLMLADLAQAHAKEAILTLVEVMTDKLATPSARVSAASELLDRGFGRAPQSLDVRTTVTISEEFEKLIRSLNRSSGDHAKVIEATVSEPEDAAE